MQRQAFVSGEFVDRKEARIEVSDTGLIRNYGVFDYLRTFGGKPFLLEEHLDRLFASASDINLPIPYSREGIEKIINKLLKKNNDKESGVRTIVTGGPAKDGIFPKGEPSFIVISKPIKQKEEIYKQGVRLLTCHHQRELAQTKTLNYLKLISHQEELEEKQAYTLLFTSNEEVLEGGTSNVFMVQDKKLVTPKNNILKGITRGLIIRLAKENDYQVKEGRVKLKELLQAPEVFLTSTTRGIMPVVKIDEQEIGKGKPGSETGKLLNIYREYTEEFKQG